MYSHYPCFRRFYFGRNLDYEFSYGDEVTVTPRLFIPHARACALRTVTPSSMAYVQGDYPLYYDAINKAGVAGFLATRCISPLRRSATT